MTKPFHMDVTERAIIRKSVQPIRAVGRAYRGGKTKKKAEKGVIPLLPPPPRTRNSPTLRRTYPVTVIRAMRPKTVPIQGSIPDCDCSRPTPGSRFCSSDNYTFFDDHTPTILADDLNAKHTAWGSRVVLPARHQLLQDAANYGYEVLGPDTPSHVPTDPRFRANVLNSVVCHRLPFPIYVEDLFDMDTQHLPILITLDTIAHLTPARPQTHRTNWSAYQRALEELHVGKSFSSPEEVDLAALHLNHEIQTAYGAATIHLPAPTCRRWDLPPCLQRALQHKRNLQRLWARMRRVI
ncbi:Probable RNA-directed DNA polymerase from transposon BS [Eumeta japonica]|uniref:Probable RNA-directed DNA polymerase from transposon BS n=1 Tax=Eumeta variegata TaxID=151549 RepID=A0A4C1WKN2_EUMVA|nr:Probable RNA-directed DNA polymerase from transposon BS [Eumeta japonica]